MQGRSNACCKFGLCQHLYLQHASLHASSPPPALLGGSFFLRPLAVYVVQHAQVADTQTSIMSDHAPASEVLKDEAMLCMQVWAVKSYTKSVPVYVQVLQRASLRMIAPFLDPERDVLVSVEQMRHRLLALSCLCPGASTLIGVSSSPRKLMFSAYMRFVSSANLTAALSNLVPVTQCPFLQGLGRKSPC